jgi:hypothetical protein
MPRIFRSFAALFCNHDVYDEHDEWLPPQHDAKRRYPARSALIVVLVVYVVVKLSLSSEAAKNINITSYYSLLPFVKGTQTFVCVPICEICGFFKNKHSTEGGC